MSKEKRHMALVSIDMCGEQNGGTPLLFDELIVMPKDALFEVVH